MNENSRDNWMFFIDALDGNGNEVQIQNLTTFTATEVDKIDFYSFIANMANSLPDDIRKINMSNIKQFSIAPYDLSQDEEIDEGNPQ